MIFPQAILLLVWIVYDLTGFFIKNTTQSEHKKVFGLLKMAWIQIIVVLVLTTIVFATRFETISNYFGATNEKILHLDYDGQVEKMWVVDNDNLLLFGQSNSNNNIFKGSTSTYLMLRNVGENKIVWAIPDKFIKTIYFDKNQQKVYAVASKDFAEIKPSNPTDLLVIEARTGQISQTISLNDKPLKYISNINVNPTGEVLLSGAPDNFTKNIFNLTANSFLKDQFSSIISFSARSKLSDNGKFLLNIANQVQPVQFSVIDLATNQKILEYQKELTSYNGYNNDYTIAGNYVITFDEQKNMFEVFVSERESSRYQSDFNQKLSFNFQTKKVEEARENISWQLASKNLADKYGVINSAGTRLAYLDQSSMKIFKVENQKMTLTRTIKLADKYQGMNKGYTFLPGTSTLVLASRYRQLHFFDIN